MTDLNKLMKDRAEIDAAIQAQKPMAVARVVALMEELGLTWSDLGVAPTAQIKPVAKRVVKYRDEQGNAWAGVGQRPRWLQARLVAGADLEQFRVKG